MEIFYIFVYLIILLILLLLIQNYFNGPWTQIDPKLNLKNKIIIVTGSSKGIGKETAITLLEKGAKVIFACRDENRTNNLIDSINDLKMRSNSFFIKLDVSNLPSIESFIKEFKVRFKKFDILINNAGINTDKFRLISGIESTIMTNYIGPFYLTNELIANYSNEKSRIINLSSSWHEYCTEKYLNDWLNKNQSEKNHNIVSTYSLATLCNIIHARYLNEYFIEKNIDIKACSVHPGQVRSELSNNYEKFYLKFLMKFLQPFLYLFAKTTLAGAQTTLHCCYIDYEEFISGGYYSNCKLTVPSKFASNKLVNEKIIKETIRTINEIKGKDKNTK